MLLYCSVAVIMDDNPEELINRDLGRTASLIDDAPAFGPDSQESVRTTTIFNLDSPHSVLQDALISLKADTSWLNYGVEQLLDY